MSFYGKQHRYCPNCGKHLYDDNVSVNHVRSMMCSDKCRDEWSYKYVGKILGKDAPNETETATEKDPTVSSKSPVGDTTTHSYSEGGFVE